MTDGAMCKGCQGSGVIQKTYGRSAFARTGVWAARCPRCKGTGKENQ